MAAKTTTKQNLSGEITPVRRKQAPTPEQEKKKLINATLHKIR